MGMIKKYHMESVFFISTLHIHGRRAPQKYCREDIKIRRSLSAEPWNTVPQKTTS